MWTNNKNNKRGFACVYVLASVHSRARLESVDNWRLLQYWNFEGRGRGWLGWGGVSLNLLSAWGPYQPTQDQPESSRLPAPPFFSLVCPRMSAAQRLCCLVACFFYWKSKEHIMQFRTNIFSRKNVNVCKDLADIPYQQDPLYRTPRKSFSLQLHKLSGVLTFWLTCRITQCGHVGI